MFKYHALNIKTARTLKTLFMKRKSNENILILYLDVNKYVMYVPDKCYEY